MLDEVEIVPFLLQRNLITPADIVNGELQIENASRRNRNFKVTRNGAPGYLLKQGVGDERRRTVAQEGAAYVALSSLDGLAALLPRFHGFDKQGCVLILELLQDGQSLADYLEESGRLSTERAKLVGEALGTLHTAATKERLGPDGSSKFAPFTPLPFRLRHPRLGVLQHFSRGNMELLRIVRETAGYCDFLDEAATEWKEETLIHGDLRWDNCHVVPPSSGRRRKAMKIVDWELAGWGDPCWDVAMVFSEYITFWLRSAPITKDTPPGKLFELTKYPLHEVQKALESFRGAYARRMAWDEDESSEKFLKAVRFLGARLIHTTFELLQNAPRLTVSAVYLLQLSYNILERPRHAAEQLLGMPASVTCGKAEEGPSQLAPAAPDIR